MLQAAEGWQCYFDILPDGPIFEIFTHILKKIMIIYIDKLLDPIELSFEKFKQKYVLGAVSFFISSKKMYEKFKLFREYYKKKLYILLVYRNYSIENIHKNGEYEELNVSLIRVFDAADDALSYIINNNFNHLFIENYCFSLFDFIDKDNKFHSFPWKIGGFQQDFPDNFPTDGGQISDSEDEIDHNFDRDDSDFDDRLTTVSRSTGDDDAPTAKPGDRPIFYHKNHPEVNNVLPCGTAFYYTINNEDSFFYLEIHRKKKHSFINIIFNLSGENEEDDGMNWVSLGWRYPLCGFHTKGGRYRPKNIEIQFSPELTPAETIICPLKTNIETKFLIKNRRIKFCWPIHEYMIMKELMRPPGNNISSYSSKEKIEKWESAADVQSAKIILKNLNFS
jgi:hypothetical protein